MVAKDKAEKDQPPPAHRWELVGQFRARANQAADILRALLFALCSGALYVIIDKNYSNIGRHLVPVILFGLAIATLVWSWDLQKSKSIERFKKLRDEGYDEYLKGEGEISEKWWRKNEVVDRICYALILLGAIFEIAILYCPPSGGT